jgi:excisionase family DNA binding protein
MHLLSIPQAAERLGVTPSLVRRWCRAGRLGTKVGTPWVITEAELRVFAKTRRGPGRPKEADSEK